MNDLIAKGVDYAESIMLEKPQVECPVIHHFGDGIYIREVNIPAGTIAMGHRQKRNHLNIFLEGKKAMITNNGVIELEAPQILFGTPGRKMSYIIEDCRWLNIYATDETDIEKLEEMLFDKSDTWQEKEKENLKVRTELRKEDRDDFEKIINKGGNMYGIESSLAASLINYVPVDFKNIIIEKISIRTSEIHGKGIFANYPIKKDDIIGPVSYNGEWTQLKRYLNHSKKPNAFLHLLGDGNIILVANEQIYGCISGGKGDEITINYDKTIKEGSCLEWQQRL